MRAARLSLILPDVVGDQLGSIALASEYGVCLGSLAGAGHELLVPMQRGSLTLGEYFCRYRVALGFAPTGFAIPSNAAAMPPKELQGLAAIANAPRRVHFLGISRRSKALALRVHTLRGLWADVEVSADACEHRAEVGQHRPITLKRAQELDVLVGLERDQVDDTEYEAWDDAEATLRGVFPHLSDEDLTDVLCSPWGVTAFHQALGQQLEAECGPAATARSIEDFARRRFAP